METTAISFPVDEDFLFSNHKGKRTNRIEKRRRKLAQQISFISPFLRDDEQVMLITTGCSPMSFLEQYLAGFTIYYVKRSIFVFTNQRIFHVPTKTNYAYRSSIAQIELGDCSRIRMKGHRLVVDYNSKKTETFVYIASKERKKIKALVDTLSIGSNESSITDRTFLCPRCTSMLEKGNETCKSCRLQFKSRAAGRKISILIPGGGYFFTRHPILGFFDALVEFFLLLGVVVSVMGYLNGEEGAIESTMVLGILLAFEKLVSVYHADHFLDEFLPIETDIQVKPKSN